jgi:DNA topoisomerase-3
MEGAGKLIDDDELREAMAEKGLGTPATRAQVIEGLILEKYMLREGPRAGAHGQGLPADDAAARPGDRGPDQARAHRQLGIPAGRDGARPPERDAFMAEIAKMAERIVRKAKEYDRDTIPGDYATLATPCPNCGGVVKENYRRFACTGADRRAAKAAAFPSPRSRPAAPSSWPRPRPSCATRRSARWRASAPRPAGPSRPS